MCRDAELCQEDSKRRTAGVAAEGQFPARHQVKIER